MKTKPSTGVERDGLFRCGIQDTSGPQIYGYARQLDRPADYARAGVAPLVGYLPGVGREVPNQQAARPALSQGFPKCGSCFEGPPLSGRAD